MKKQIKIYKVEMIGRIDRVYPDVRTFLGYARGDPKDIEAYFKIKRSEEADYGCDFEVLPVELVNVTPELLLKAKNLEQKIRESSKELKKL